jgi:hypothetical protein
MYSKSAWPEGRSETDILLEAMFTDDDGASVSRNIKSYTSKPGPLLNDTATSWGFADSVGLFPWGTSKPPFRTGSNRF